MIKTSDPNRAICSDDSPLKWKAKEVKEARKKLDADRAKLAALRYKTIKLTTKIKSETSALQSHCPHPVNSISGGSGEYLDETCEECGKSVIF